MEETVSNPTYTKPIFLLVPLGFPCHPELESLVKDDKLFTVTLFRGNFSEKSERTYSSEVRLVHQLVQSNRLYSDDLIQHFVKNHYAMDYYDTKLHREEVIKLVPSYRGAMLGKEVGIV